VTISRCSDSWEDCRETPPADKNPPAALRTGPSTLRLHSRTLAQPSGLSVGGHAGRLDIVAFELTVRELNERHGTNFILRGAYAGGEVGAEKLVDPNGRLFVLKRQSPGLAPKTTEVLRSVGYPAPVYVVAGEGYSVQEELPGSPLGDWEVPIPAGTIELNELQAGRAVDDDRTWPIAIVESVLTGFDDYMILSTLRQHSAEGRELLELCQQAVERHAHQLQTTDDIVHFDFTASNVLAIGGQITGVIDWCGTQSGDRTFDLATWLYYSPSASSELRRTIVSRIGESGLAVYLAHMCIRQADWSIRYHGEAAGWAMVEYGLRLARTFPTSSSGQT